VAMAATDIRILLYLYAERDFLLKLARLLAESERSDLMRELVRRQVLVDALIAETESTGVAPRPGERS
jgi:hypothetical protein